MATPDLLSRLASLQSSVSPGPKTHAISCCMSLQSLHFSPDCTTRALQTSTFVVELHAPWSMRFIMACHSSADVRGRGVVTGGWFLG